MAVIMMMLLLGSSISRTMMANTTLANPLGPNHPINIFSLIDKLVLVKDNRTGKIRTKVKLAIAYSITLKVKSLMYDPITT